MAFSISQDLPVALRKGIKTYWRNGVKVIELKRYSCCEVLRLKMMHPPPFICKLSTLHPLHLTPAQSSDLLIINVFHYITHHRTGGHHFFRFKINQIIAFIICPGYRPVENFI